MKESISITITNGYAMTDCLFFPLKEEIDTIPRIRVGKTLIDMINDYVTDTWNQCESGLFDSYKGDRIDLLSRLPSIIKVMDGDFKDFMKEVKDHRALKIIEDNIRNTTGVKDLSQLSEEQYQTNFDRALSEEMKKFEVTKNGAEFFAKSGDPRYIIFMSELGSYVQAHCYLNLYLSSVVHSIATLTENLYGSKATDMAENTVMKFNLGLNPFFVELRRNAYSFNPQGFFGGSSYETIGDIFADTLFNGARVFYGKASSMRLEDSYSHGKMSNREDSKSKRIPVLFDVNMSQCETKQDQVITPETLMEWTFQGNEPEHYSRLFANYPGGVLIVKKVGEKFAEKTVFEDYVEKDQKPIGTRLLLPKEV